MNIGYALVTQKIKTKTHVRATLTILNQQPQTGAARAKFGVIRVVLLEWVGG